MRTNQLISWWIDPFVLIHSLDSFQSSIANQCIVLDDKILRFHISMYDISLSSRKQRNKNVEIKQSVILMSPQRYLITPPHNSTRSHEKNDVGSFTIRIYLSASDDSSVSTDFVVTRARLTETGLTICVRIELNGNGTIILAGFLLLTFLARLEKYHRISSSRIPFAWQLL